MRSEQEPRTFRVARDAGLAFGARHARDGGLARGAGLAFGARVARDAGLVLAGVCLVVTLFAWYILLLPKIAPGWTPFDAVTYLAAGERLNAGHPLYALSPGDRFIAIDPPVITVPLLSPPLVAVLWRPLALLGMTGAILGGLVAAAAVLATIAALLRRQPIVTSVLLLLLSFPFAAELNVGNVHSFVFAGAAGIWWLWRRDRIWAAAAIAVILAGVKVMPVFLVLWVLVVAGRRAWVPVLVAVLIVGLLSVAGAGLQAHLDYLRVLSTTAVQGATGVSLSGYTGWGPASTLAGLALAIAMVALRRRPAVAYGCAIVGMIMVTPALYYNAFASLLLLVVPLAWPARSVSADGITPVALSPAPAT